jgi:hypothetical protein
MEEEYISDSQGAALGFEIIHDGAESKLADIA